MISNKYVLAHLSTAEQILAHYEGLEPFPVFIKAFFRDNKKFGSHDRKEISGFCYSYFRLGKAMADLPIRERILIGHFLCNTGQYSLFDEIKPEWKPAFDFSIAEKITFLQKFFPDFTITSVFPFEKDLGPDLDKDRFVLSHFIQPDLFIRLRPGRSGEVVKKLDTASISFIPVGESGLALPNTTKLDLLGEPDKAFVIQDLSSQETATFFPSPNDLPVKPTIWDACAGSGGKSIMAYDMYPKVSPYVSDERETILFNLRKRFASAGIQTYKTFLADLSETATRNKASDAFFPPSGFDLVIADVPCSGSGTWGRNPWEMIVFPESEMLHYQQLQQQILHQLIPRVKKGGFLLYITCSVYTTENEDAVDFILANSRLALCKKGLLKGYENRADTMFASLFTLPV
jgi:16S rRNA (cytosine967-C5)-methyltransferase